MNYGKIRIGVLCVLTAIDISYALYERFGSDSGSLLSNVNQVKEIHVYIGTNARRT